MTAFQILFTALCALGGGAGAAALLRAPTQNSRDRASAADVLVDAAVDVSTLQRGTISDLKRRLTAAEKRAKEAEHRAEVAERRARDLESRVSALEERIADLLTRRT